VKVLAVTDVVRNPDTPDVPTLREQGIDWDFISFRCMLVPAKTPPDRIATLEGLFKQVMEDKGFKDTMSKFGEPLYWQGSKELTEKLYKMRADMLPVVKKMKAAEKK
jgi:tripartite-type tricarboxylate transporter receptor subunit TctC